MNIKLDYNTLRVLDTISQIDSLDVDENDLLDMAESMSRSDFIKQLGSFCVENEIVLEDGTPGQNILIREV